MSLTMSLAEASGYKIGVVPPRKPSSYGCKFCPLRFMSKNVRDTHVGAVHGASRIADGRVGLVYKKSS